MKKIRSAIYTRKSAEEGLEQEFNSLDAQREACAAYVASQKAEGWVLLPTVYEDAGLSGGTLERPGLQRLLADIDAGLVEALLHGPEQIADLPVPVAESPGAVRIGHPERSHLVEYLAPNSVFNSLPRQRSSPHLRPDDRLVTIDRVLHHASLGVA